LPNRLRRQINDWDGIYVGRRKGDDLVNAGKVDHGFDKEIIRRAHGAVGGADCGDVSPRWRARFRPRTR
jgi:hypothetical protein